MPHHVGLFALAEEADGGLVHEAEEPDYFSELQLDEIVDALVVGREEHDLAPAFRARLRDPAAAERRLAVFADLADERLRAAVSAFCDGLARSRRETARAAGLRHPVQRQRWLLDALGTYADAVDGVTAALEAAAPASAALKGWLSWLQVYRATPPFRTRAQGVRGLLTELSHLRYGLLVSGSTVTARPLTDEEDLGAAASAAFARFAEQEVGTHDFALRTGTEMDLVHTAVLDMVAGLYADVFHRTALFLEEHPTAGHPALDTVERELHFVLAWLGFIEPVTAAGLPFCVPDLRPRARLDVTGVFDVLLARSLVASGRRPVQNDVAIGGGEQVLVVTGPNQGGKTTFARTLGQVQHLAALGLPVPGRSVALRLPETVLTHFERGDRADEPTSRLEGEVLRVQHLLAAAGAGSFVILNEMFSSTARADALAMSSDVLRALLDTGATGVCVTFLDELSTMDPRIVSLVAGVDDEDPTRRTFSLVRAPADGQAHALALAAAHGLTTARLQARIEARA